MTNVVIAAAARTPVGSFNGSFANTPAHELGVVAVDRADWQREIHRRVTRVDASQSLEHVEEVDADVGVEYVPDCPIHV